MDKIKHINLIPRELLKKSPLARALDLFNANKKIRNLAVIAAILLFTSITQLFAIGALSLKLKLSNRRIQQAKVRLSRLQSQALELEKQKNEVAREEGVKKERLSRLLSTSSESRSYADLFGFIAGLAPQELWIKDLSVNQQQVDISGMTLNPQLIIQFMNQLDGSGAFRDSFFSSSEKETVNNQKVYSFQVSTTPVWGVLDAGAVQ